jgi:hypothetical protein
MLAKVISQLDADVYSKLRDDLTETRAEKMLQLLELYRTTRDEASITHKQLDINTSAFYTLKSRLQDKVQKTLFANASDVYADLLKNLAAIPYLVNNTPRESAIMLLNYLADELKHTDQPGELAQVYGALKKLNSWDKDYFHYQQLYNKNVAYFLAIEKAEETLTHFTRDCGVYCYSLEKQSVDVLRLYVKELNNLARVYDSHRIKMYKYIAEVSYALFVDLNREIPGSDATIEETLEKMSEILTKHGEDRHYRFIGDIWQFLNYEYYVSLGLQKNAAPFFDHLLKGELRMLYRTHTALVSRFLITAGEKIIANKAIADSVSAWIPEPDENDLYSKTNNALFTAALKVNAGDYGKAAAALNDFLNENTLKNMFASEYNVKLLLVLCLLLAEKTDQAEIQFRSISRKIASTENKDSLQPGVTEWVNMCKLVLTGGTDKKAKLTETVEALNKVRRGNHVLLPHVKVNEQMVGILQKLL